MKLDFVATEIDRNPRKKHLTGFGRQFICRRRLPRCQAGFYPGHHPNWSVFMGQDEIVSRVDALVGEIVREGSSKSIGGNGG